MWLLAGLSIVLGLPVLCYGIEEVRDWGRVVRTETCGYQEYKAECRSGEIILVTSAWYGRMEESTCINPELGHVGCKADVINILDSECTRKTRCNLPVLITDQSFRELSPCVRGLTLYLKSTYACVKDAPDMCSYHLATLRQQYLPSSQIYDSNCEGQRAVNLEVAAGQQLNLTLINLQTASDVTVGSYGVVIDTMTGETTPIYPTGSEVTVLKVTSQTSLRVELNEAHRHSKFLIGYKAVGCPDIVGPAGAVFERRGSEASVSCEESEQTWHLVCRGVHWVGVIGNCTKKAPAAAAAAQEVQDVAEEDEWTLMMSREVIFLLTGCATLLAAIIIVTTGYVCLKRTSLRVSSQYKPVDNAPVMLVNSDRTASDYLTPQHMRSDDVMCASYEVPQPEMPREVPKHSDKKNNDDDYTSTDYTRKYFVLDKDYIAVNNLFRKA